ncbi:MAG: DUF2157 domain-containing protein, partial [Gaiellaceae bacterium]
MDVLEVGLLVLAVLLLVAGGSVGIATARPGSDWREAAARPLGILGSAAIGAGIILFFAANWSDIPRWLRFGILLAGLVAVLGAAFWLLEVRRIRRNVGHGLVLVGAVLFGASLFLVGQTYHVQAHDPLAFLAWSAGALSLALYFRSPATAGLAIVAFEAWLVHELVVYDDFDRGLVYVPFALALYGIALYAVGIAAQPWLAPLRVDGAMRTIGFALAAFMTLVLGFRYAHASRAAPDGVPLAVLLATGVVAVVASVAACLRRRGVELLEPLVALLGAVLVLLAALLPQHGREDRFLDFQASVYPLLFDSLLVVVIAGAIVLGARRGQLWLSSAAIVIGMLAVVLHFLD